LIRGEPLFVPVLLASLLVHALLFVLLMLVPGGGSQETIKIYRVEIVEAPSRPQARDLRFSTAALSALSLEAPALTPERPPEAPAATPPSPAAPAAPQAPKAPETAATSPVLPSPPLPTAPRGLPQQAPAAPAPPPSMAAPSATQPVAPQPPTAQSAPQPPADSPLLREQSPLEALRQKVQQLELQVESAPAAPGAATGLGDPTRPPNPLALRRYQARIQERVKQNYTFPGGFDAALAARVLVVIARDGSKQKIEIIQSSGNERFDYAVMLTLRGTEFPPLPKEIEGETLSQTFLFSPN
jgi:TonB family protein